MKTAFYYIRGKDVLDNSSNHPYGCVCVVKADDGKVARGISICSYKDTFSKQTGRNKAEGYAIRALNSNKPVLKRYGGFLMGILDAVFKDPEATNKFIDAYSYKYPQSMLLVDADGNVPEYAKIAALTDFEKKILED